MCRSQPLDLHVVRAGRAIAVPRPDFAQVSAAGPARREGRTSQTRLLAQRRAGSGWQTCILLGRSLLGRVAWPTLCRSQPPNLHVVRFWVAENRFWRNYVQVSAAEPACSEGWTDQTRLLAQRRAGSGWQTCILLGRSLLGRVAWPTLCRSQPPNLHVVRFWVAENRFWRNYVQVSAAEPACSEGWTGHSGSKARLCAGLSRWTCTS